MPPFCKELLSHLALKQLSAVQAMYMAERIIDAVHYMHCHDPIIIHQDLKPQNVLVRAGAIIRASYK